MQLNATKHEEVDRLLEHLIRGPTWRFHALLRACVLTGQGHVVRKLGFDPDVYLKGQQEPGGPLSSSGRRDKLRTLLGDVSYLLIISMYWL